jgi:hypothetical protein
MQISLHQFSQRQIMLQIFHALENMELKSYSVPTREGRVGSR